MGKATGSGRSVSVKYKFAALFVVILLVFSGAILFSVTRLIAGGAEEAAVEKAKSDLATGRAIIDLHFPGDWRVQGESLYKGEALMNSRFDIVDEIGELTGDTVTIFLGDTRITTNVLNEDGTRAVRTKVSDAVAQAVLVRGEPYYGEAEVVGQLYQTAYEPLKNAAGEVVGIWYVGVSKEFVDGLIREAYKGVAATGAVMIVLALAAWSFLSGRFLIAPLERLAVAAGHIAEGRLRERVPVRNRDEINQVGAAFNRLAESLDSLISRVQDNAVQLAAHSQELSAASQNVSAAVEDLTATTSEMAVSTEQASTHATEASEAARATETAADAGSQAVMLATETVGAIQQKVNHSTQTVQELNEQSAQIGQIIRVINDIADQTNLLALNAAIEAARAGEHGRGFAVVAEEVRKLAEESSQATQEIGAIVNAIQGNTALAVEAMREGSAAVDEGVQIIGRAGATLDNIREYSARSTDLAAEIAEMTGQSAQGLQSLAASSEEVTSTVEQMAASSNELALMAATLNELVMEIRKEDRDSDSETGEEL